MPQSTISAERREATARVIDPEAFSPGPEFPPRRGAFMTKANRRVNAFTKADAILNPA